MQNRKIIALLAVAAILFSASYAAAAPSSVFYPTVLPQANNTYDLGSTALYWRNAYVNQLCLSGDCKSIWPTGGSGSNYFTNSGASTYLSTGTNLGVGSSTPYGRLAVDNAPNDLTPYLVFNSGSTTTGTTTNFSISPAAAVFHYLDTGPTINSGFIVNYNTADASVVPHGDDIQINGADNNHAALYIDSHSGLWPTINLRVANGTGASPSATTAGEELGRLAFRGYSDVNWTGSLAAISGVAAENTSSTSQGAYLQFKTTTLGTVGGGSLLLPVERVRVQPSGGVSIGNSTFNATDPGNGILALLTGLQTPYASTTNISLAGQLYDSLNSPGTNGYVLQTTGAGTTWVATSTLGLGGGGGGSGTVNSGTTGQFPYYAAPGTALTATSSIFLAASGNIGIGTTTPQYSLTVANQAFISDLTGIGLIPAAANSLVVGTTTATGSWIGASVTNSGASTNAAAVVQGLNVTAAWGPNSTVNSTFTTLGGGVRSRYQARNNSIGLNVADASAVTAQCIVNGTAASTTDCAAFNAENPAISSGNLLTNSYGLWVRGLSVAGTITNHYGVYVESLVSGTNRFGIYQAGTSDPNYLAGNTGFGTTSPYAQLSIGGGNLVIGAATAGGTPGDLYLPKLGTSAGSFLAVDATGKVIATTSPTNGTVTSVGLSVPTGLSISGSPVTTSGTLALTLTAGYVIPLTASTTDWNTAYLNRITSASSPLSISGNAISIQPATSGQNGYLSSTDWTTFNNKVATTRTLTAGAGLTGGGDLSGDRSFAIDFTRANTWTGLTVFSATTTNATSTFTQVGVGTTTPTFKLDIDGGSGNIFRIIANAATAVMSVVGNTVTALGTWDFSNATVISHTYPAFTYATSTAWTGTTTIPLGVAYTQETWKGVKCFTDAGTVGVSFYDGTNRMNYVPTASTTVNLNALTTNNSYAANTKRYVDVGTPASSPTKISCTVDKIINQ